MKDRYSISGTRPPFAFPYPGPYIDMSPWQTDRPPMPKQCHINPPQITDPQSLLVLIISLLPTEWFNLPCSYAERPIQRIDQIILRVEDSFLQWLDSYESCTTGSNHLIWGHLIQNASDLHILWMANDSTHESKISNTSLTYLDAP